MRRSTGIQHPHSDDSTNTKEKYCPNNWKFDVVCSAVWFPISTMITVILLYRKTQGIEGKQREPTERNQHGDGCNNKRFITKKYLAIFLEITVCTRPTRATPKTWCLVFPLIPVPPFVHLAQHPQIFFVYRKNNSILFYSSYLLMNLL